jgi:hypothetical protein
MEKEMESSIGTFGGTSTYSQGMTNKTWYLIFSNGSQYDSAVNIKSF